MKRKQWLFYALSGFLAGTVTGFFGAGGGMLLVPLLSIFTDLKEDSLFPASVSIILPICLICLVFTASSSGLPWQKAFPYLLGSCAGGVLAGILGRKIPSIWLHRLLGLLILWGGIRYLC